MLGTYHLNALYEILNHLHFLYNTERIYSHILENLVKALNSEAASLFILNKEKGTLSLRACLGPKKDRLELVTEDFPFPLGKGICGWVAQYNQPVLVNEARQDVRFNPQVDVLTGYKTESVLCVPISNNDEVLGVIEILNKKMSEFNKNDQDLLLLIARQTAIALQNAQLYEELSNANTFSESVIANLSGGFIAIDPNETITRVNAAAERILGISSSESVGKKCCEMLRNFPELHQELAQILQTKTKKIRQELNCTRSDGSSLQLGYSTFLIEDQKKNILGAAILFQDLSVPSQEAGDMQLTASQRVQ